MVREKIKKLELWKLVLAVGGVIIALELAVLALFLVNYFREDTEQTATMAEATNASRREIRVPAAPAYPSNEFDAEDFVYVGDYLSCTAADSILGVDVSHYQGEIDWQKVKEAGFHFAIIRVGGRGYGEAGNLFADENAQKNYEGAKAAGIAVGAYFFSQAITEQEAREEAQYTIGLISGWDLDLPVVYDWEWVSDEARTAHIEEDQKIDFTLAFCELIEASGRKAMVYVAPWASEEYMVAVREYPIWVVQYTDQITFPYRFDMWQYSCTGRVPGINGDVDINIAIRREEE